MALRQPCSVCGTPAWGARCPSHKVRQRHAQSRIERGYDSAYYINRKALFKKCEEWWARGIVVPCVICGRPVTRETFSAEHVKPLRDGGGSANNLAPAHKACNYGWRRAHAAGR